MDWPKPKLRLHFWPAGLELTATIAFRHPLTSRFFSLISVTSLQLPDLRFGYGDLLLLGPFKMGGLNGFPFTGLTVRRRGFCLLLEQIFLAKRERILGAPDRLVEPTAVMYEAIEARIDKLVSRTTYPCTHVILMGAILLNADHDAGSFASLRRLRYLNVKSGASLDWTGEFAD